MIVTRESSEAEMIAEFLRQEHAARDRYGERIDACLREEGVDAAIITAADLTDPEDNAARRRVFARYRGYGTGESSYLTGFPDTGVSWAWWRLTPQELLRVRYIRYSYWMALSGGTRSPAEAARRIRDGIEVYGVSNAAFLELADRLRDGLRVPSLILVAAASGNPDALVVLEGHARITAYALAPDAIPDPIDVLVGTSPAIARWDEY
jgi:hypothetical protein